MFTPDRKKDKVNGTKALLSLSLGVIALMSYMNIQQIMFEYVMYDRTQHQAYATFFLLMIVSAVGALAALALSLNFVQRWLYEPKPAGPDEW